jgi:hypothetical protein
MPDYSFYAGYIRYIVGKTVPEKDEIAAMMEELTTIANIVESRDTFVIRADHLRLVGRALAGVAGFLQQHILPETVAESNETAEAEVRWVIDTSMRLVADLLSHAETTKDSEDYQATLPPPPEG